MLDFDSLFNEIFSIAKVVFPVSLGLAVFRVGFRLILRSVFSPPDIFEVPKFVNKKPVKLDKKYYPNKYDIPDKQRDFIQLN